MNIEEVYKAFSEEHGVYDTKNRILYSPDLTESHFYGIEKWILEDEYTDKMIVKDLKDLLASNPDYNYPLYAWAAERIPAAGSCGQSKEGYCKLNGMGDPDSKEDGIGIDEFHASREELMDYIRDRMFDGKTSSKDFIVDDYQSIQKFIKTVEKGKDKTQSANII